jgi:hypothetical protein
VTKWCVAIKLVLNLDKTNIVKFITKNSSHSTFHIGYKEKDIEEMVSTKFLGLEIDNQLKWKIHIKHMIPNLSEHVMPLGRWSLSIKLTLPNQFTLHGIILLYNTV